MMNNVQRWGTMNRAQMTHDVSFGPWVCFFFSILLYLTYFLFSLATMMIERMMNDAQRWGTMNDGEQGPNDTQCVIWAMMGMLLFSYIYISNLFFI